MKFEIFANTNILDLEIEICKVSSENLIEIKEILQVCQLPFEDISLKNSTYFIARISGKPVGCIGLEIYGSLGLLRSLAVLAEFREKKIGDALCAALFNLAYQKQLDKLYLLTTIAAEYFCKYNFKITGRSEVSEIIKESGQFKDICPVSAICMVREINYN